MSDAAGSGLTDDLAPEARLARLGIVLPKAPGAVANYVPWAIVQGVVMTSGQLPWIDGDLKYAGRIGRDLDGDQGYQACRLSTLNAIAQLRDAAGSLDNIRRVFRLEGTLNVADGYHDHPRALNGSSDLVMDVFGPRGLHTRMIYTNPVMPLDCACLVVLYAEIDTIP